MNSITKHLSIKWISYFQNSTTKHYQYTRKVAVCKLPFWVRWHVLLVCCRLQELEISDCEKMTDRGLLEGIGRLLEITHLHLTGGCNLTAQALSKFINRPSMASIVSLILSACLKLDDEGLKGIAERYKNLTYLHVKMYWAVLDMQCKCLCVAVRELYLRVCIYRCIHLKELAVCGCHNITDAGISTVISHCNQLRVLNLKDLPSITGMCAHCEDYESTLCFIMLFSIVFLQQVHHWQQSPTTGPYCEPV